MLQTVLDISCAPSVQGCFHVAAQQPVLYTVQESLNLLALDNMVSQLCTCTLCDNASVQGAAACFIASLVFHLCLFILLP